MLFLCGGGVRALGASLRRMKERRRARDKGRFHNSSDETYRGKAACAGEEAPAGPFLAQGHTRARGRLTVRNVSYTNSRAAGDSLPARRVRGGPLRQLAMSGLPARLPAGAERAKRISDRMDGMTAKPGTTSTADRILDAAIGLMNTKGYNPVSVREIA